MSVLYACVGAGQLRGAGALAQWFAMLVGLALILSIPCVLLCYNGRMWTRTPLVGPWLIVVKVAFVCPSSTQLGEFLVLWVPPPRLVLSVACSGRF